ECPAAGGFLLTDAQPDLFDLFEPGAEAIYWQTLDECRELLRDYLANPGARRSVALRARQRVLKQHTYQHRLREMVRLLKEHLAG
ncbi:MAG TPA: glycosyltransferase, partial [Candidatus Hydrogenedentes bacterium]|nr:glycosyltransferase [Candidatus Hydrogenedentota bacterium]